MRRSLFVVLLLLPAARAAAQQDWRATLDLVTVQERPAFLEAFGKILEGQEDAAVAGLEQVLLDFASDPDLYIVHYNLACAHARRGRTDEALACLERAVEQGYGLQVGQVENMRSDPDLAPLADLPGFQALEARAEARLLALAEGWQAELQPDVYVPERSAEETPEAWPVLILLHGYAGSQEEILARFRPFADQHGFLLLAPSSTHLISPGRWGWYVEPGEFLDSFRRDTRNILLAFRKVAQQHPVDPARVLVVGHGQGASLGFALVARNPQWLRGGVLFGGGYAPSVTAGWVRSAAWWGRRMRWIHGAEDPLFPPEGLGGFLQVCQDHGLAVDLQMVPGGHDWPADLEAVLGEAITWVTQAPFDRGEVPEGLMESTEVVLPPVPDKGGAADDR